MELGGAAAQVLLLLARLGVGVCWGVTILECVTMVNTNKALLDSLHQRFAKKNKKFLALSALGRGTGVGGYCFVLLTP